MENFFSHDLVVLRVRTWGSSVILSVFINSQYMLDILLKDKQIGCTPITWVIIKT